MTELTMAELAQSQIAKREAKAEQNRRDFPEGTKALMVVRNVFGESARMVYIEENGRSIGRLP